MASLSELVSRMEISSNGEDHEDVLVQSAKILHLYPNDQTALKTRTIAFVKLDRYLEASKVFEKNEELRAILPIEYAYVLYKLNHVEKLEEFAALRLAGTAKERGVQHALAQAFYKNENTSRAIDVYQNLLSPGQFLVDNEQTDLLVNIRAVQALRQLNQEPLYPDLQGEDINSHDQQFNDAIIAIGQRDFSKALDLLKKAKSTCQNIQGFSAQELEAELVPILLQAAYVEILSGHDSEALSILKALNIDTIADASLRQIAINNSLYLEGTASVDPHLNLRILESAGDVQKLSTRQITCQTKILDFNRLLLEALCLKDISSSAKKYSIKYPGSFGAQSLQFINSDVSVQDLKHKLKSDPQNLSLVFALAHAYIQKSNYEAAELVLSNLRALLLANPDNLALAHSPGLVGVLASLYKLRERRKALQDLFNATLEYWNARSNGVDEELIKALIVGLSATKQPGISSKVHTAAAKLSKEADSTAALLTCGTVGEINAIKSKGLIPAVNTSIDAEALDKAGIWPLLKAKPAISYSSVGKVTKKKKTKSTEGADKLDSERWLPKRDRSTWRPKRKEKKKALQSTQGGATDTTTVTSTVSTTAQTTVVQTKQKAKKKKSKR